MRALLLATPLSLDAALAAVKNDGAGAVVLMLGLVRNHTVKDGAAVAVTALEYEAHTEMAAAVIDALIEVEERRVPGLLAVVHHRVGALAIGDTAVVVAVSSPHRGEAFAACQALIDGLKREAPIWKREHDATGITWVGLGP